VLPIAACMLVRCSIRWVSVATCVSLALACARGHQPASPETQSASPTAVKQAATPAVVAPAAPATAKPETAPDPGALVARGAELYGRICAICHGVQGEGYRADQAPALGHQDFLATVSDEYLDFAIRYGRSGTTMSAWALDQGGPLSSDDVRAVIAFLRSWQQQPSRTLDDGPILGDGTRGKQIFDKNCRECHGRKGTYVRIVNRQLLTKAHTGFLRDAIRTGRAGTRMVSFEKALGNQGVEDVVAYLKSLPGWLVPGETPGSARPHPVPLGKLPLNPNGPEPKGFSLFPKLTSLDVIGPAYSRHARMALLDARAPSDYMDRHISGAVSVPYYDPGPYLDGLPKHTWLICYCGCPTAESGALARQLLEAGFDKVTVLGEGFGAWIEKGYPTHTGIEP
jgi:cytochrome c oxidase cbb3-type subunit 3